MALSGSRFRSPLAVLGTTAAILATACSRPQPPRLTPKEARVVSIDLSGFDVRVKMDALNPNGFELSVQSVVAHVIIDGNQDLGTVTTLVPITLPANAHSLIDVPLNVKWRGIGGLASIAAAKRSVPYTVDGTATVGGPRLHVEVPFRLEGVITAEQVQQAGLKSLRGIVGSQGLPGLLPAK